MSKEAYAAMPVCSLLSIRYLLALALLLLFAGRRIRAGLRACSPRDWLPFSLCIAGSYVLSNLALPITAATSVAFLRSLSTVMTPVLVLVVYRTRYRWQYIPIQLLMVLGLLRRLASGDRGAEGLGRHCLPGRLLPLTGYLLQNAALEKLPARTVALLQCTCPVMTALFSNLILGEHLSPAGVAGAIVILLCVMAETLPGGRE